MVLLDELLEALTGATLLVEKELVPALEIVGNGGHPAAYMRA